MAIGFGRSEAMKPEFPKGSLGSSKRTVQTKKEVIFQKPVTPKIPVSCLGLKSEPPGEDIILI